MRHLLATLVLAGCAAAGAAPASPSSSDAKPAPVPQIVHVAEDGSVELRPGAPHVVRAVDTGNGVSVEVLDWGGSGPPLVLLAGLGNSAHIFDDLASAFLDRCHVLGLSRRGFGGSSVTEGGYDVPNLGADVLRTLDVLGVQRAVFIGHSAGGEELTWLGSEHPERVLGLIYLDAAYDRIALRSQRLPPKPEPAATPIDLASPVGYAAFLSRGMQMPLPLDEILATFRFDGAGRFVGSATDGKVLRQVAEGQRAPDYARLRAPALALYALADHWTPDYASFAASEREKFAGAVPSARVTAIPHSKHYLFLTHRAEVVAEIERFLAQLPRSTG